MISTQFGFLPSAILRGAVHGDGLDVLQLASQCVALQHADLAAAGVRDIDWRQEGYFSSLLKEDERPTR